VVSNNTNINRRGPSGPYRPGFGGPYWPGAGYGGWYRPGVALPYRPNPYLAYHRGWVNGFWNPNYYSSGWGWGGWRAPGTSALAWGVGLGMAAWGMGSVLNSWGYSSFVNPYYTPSSLVVQQPAVVVQQPPVVYDYSRPLDLASPPPAQEVVDRSVASFDSARAAFRAGDYVRALDLAGQALQQTPNDPMLHQFRAICLFALGRYDEAAVPLYAVLSAGPGWDWTTLVGLYPDVATYTRQLHALEAYCLATPRAASARFVLAALYMTQGNNDMAAAWLKQVVELQPRDRLAAQLVEVLTAKPPSEPARAAAEPVPIPSVPATAVTSVDLPSAGPTPAPAPTEAASDAGPPLPTGPVPARLLGSWAATPAQGVTITLNLDDQKSFTWKVTDRGQSREFRGGATLDNDTLALAPPDQPPMIGQVTWKDDGHFLFKALGAPADDPGLTFSR
jgi:hypothetical protein